MRDVALLPQALGQCSHFLATNLPTARLVKVSSTAAAAEAVSMQAGDEAADSAAICSKICLQLFGNLEMLQEGIQDSHRESEPVFLGGSAARRETFVSDNFTRFYILANHPSSPLPNTRSNGRGECNALVRLEVLLQTAESQGARVTVSDLLAALRLPVVRMDRRPSITVPHERFGSVYLVEVMDDERSDGFRPSECGGEVGTTSLPSWKDRVLSAIARVVESGGRATLLGTW